MKREERNKLQQAEGAGSDRGSTQPRVGASQSWFCSHLGVSRHARDPTTRHLGDSSGYGFPFQARFKEGREKWRRLSLRGDGVNMEPGQVRIWPESITLTG